VDFVAVVDQALALLRQRGRVTYRTLQRQFQLDAEALTDLLAELRYAHPDELREDDQGVVWTGEAGTAAALAPPSIGPNPTLILLANSYAAFRRAKGEYRVFACGVPANHSPIRTTLSAAAVAICCKCVFASPI
jgi:hypothetical protein